MVETEGGLSDTEQRTLRDLGDQAGARVVYLVDHSRPLSDAEALAEMKAQRH